MTLRVSLPLDSTSVVAREAELWRDGQVMERLWLKDPTVWADPLTPEIADRLGWLDAPADSRSLIPQIEALRDKAIESGITDIVLLGMGGSSLAPEVFASTLPLDESCPKLTVLDSTHPTSVRNVTSATHPSTTWYIVASKSGGTVETMSLFRHFWAQVADRIAHPGSHFLAVTDPGTSLESLATDRGFRATVIADPNVGGRYSALTAFGLVPTGLVGGDISLLLDRAEAAALSCRPEAPLEANPAFGIGAVLANRAGGGADKAQFVSASPVATIGIWIEQLIAESTGKHGVGIVPIDGGPSIPNDPDATVVAIGNVPAQTGDITISVDDPYDVAGVMFILELATAVAGKCLDINPFDQPDVQLAKKLATTAMEGDIGVDETPPVDVSDSVWIDSFTAVLREQSPTYISIQAYVPQSRSATAILNKMRSMLSEESRSYATVGFGPRFLHSTGQLHKGGPSGGLYLQIISNTGKILDVPESDYSFNELIAAQARGDRAALADRGRNVIAVRIGDDVDEGLTEMVRQLATEFTDDN
jgi:transaldolase/glucose-6-phosphate isomerase